MIGPWFAAAAVAADWRVGAVIGLAIVGLVVLLVGVPLAWFLVFA